MSQTQEHVPDEGTVQLLGSKGNIYEENELAQREVPLLAQILNARPKGGRDDAKLDAAAEAAKAIAGGGAAPDHGKATGASNAIAFHTFGQEADADKDED